MKDEFKRPNMIQEFFVDLLGGLVPGILFVVASSIAVFPAINALINSCGDSGNIGNFYALLKDILSSSKETPNMIWVALFTLTFIISYIVGHLFYRQDPKIPDTQSFIKASKKKPKGVITDDEIRKWKRDSFACESPDDCQFPYEYLTDYLIARGHTHLADMITWNERNQQRSKTFINQIKIRLDYHFPEKYKRITRNEAHVRLATSTWYVGKILFWLSISGISIVVISFLIFTGINGTESSLKSIPEFFSRLAYPAFILALATFSVSKTENFIHYQRLREAFYVLELAYTAFMDDDKLKKRYLPKLCDDEE